LIRSWLTAFAFTQLVEVPIYSVGMRCSLLAAFGASAITHPIVWFVIFNPAWAAPYPAKVVASELFAWLAEAAYFRLLTGNRRAIAWALLANATSFGAGMLSRFLFGVP
jgi:hypothetical protein